MHTGNLVFAQVMEHLPLTTFRRYLWMAFAQLTYRESLRDIEACLRAQSSTLYHMGIRNPMARNTLANANATRDWRIDCELAQSLIATARRLYANEPCGLDLKETVYALDATTIDLGLSGFPGRRFASPRRRSNCTHSWTCAATFRRSSSSATANSARSTCWISWFPNRVPSM